MCKSYFKENLMYRMPVRNTLSGIPNEETETEHIPKLQQCTVYGK